MGHHGETTSPAAPVASLAHPHAATAFTGWRELFFLLPTWLALAWLVSKASWFWNTNPDLQFGWVVVLLCAYLFWEVWPQRPTAVFEWSWQVLWLGAAAVVLFFTQLYQAGFGMTPASLSGLALGVFLVVGVNLSFVYGGGGVRHFAFAFAFLLVALPVPSVIYHPLVTGLQSHVAAADVELLNLLGIPAQHNGAVIALPNCTVGIDEACSGIRSLQSTVMATLFIGYLTLKNNSGRVALFVSGIGLALLGNLIRSLALSLVANARGSQAIESFHDAAGWSILAFTVAGVAAFAWALNKLERKWRTPQSGLAPGANGGGGRASTTA